MSDRQLNRQRAGSGSILGAIPLDLVQQLRQAHYCFGDEILADSGQRRIDIGRDRRVVVPTTLT
jgi:hypothetical protein